MEEPCNALHTLESLGQSVWLDFIHRRLFASGELEALITRDGVSGMTSNPTIFEKAFAGGDEYEAQIHAMIRRGMNAGEMYEALTIDDIRSAADRFRPVYDRTAGEDGYVSLEVSPHLAYDAEGTFREAHRLWAAVDRPNIFIKVPATLPGLPAIRRLTHDGLNINVTLLFGLQRYREVAEAYIAGLQDRAAEGKPLGQITSVASFFLSRIDVMVDSMLEEAMRDPAKTNAARACLGQTAIASAKMAYQLSKRLFGANFRHLAEQGARPQHVLWASTGTKNPAYSDIKYIEPLIGANTVTTMPLETLEAYRDHGRPAARLEKGVDAARAVLQTLPDLGINPTLVSDRLEAEGVNKFIEPYDKALLQLEEQRMWWAKAA